MTNAPAQSATSNWKAIALLKGRDDMPREEVIAYYESNHVPLILSLFPQIRTYRRNFADFTSAYVYEDAAPFDFDIVTEIIFESREAYEAMAALSADPEIADRIARDEENFLDRGKTRMFVVQEHESRR